MNKLYEAILDDPENDTLRLIYADWLDDNERYDEAELIRVQVEIEQIKDQRSVEGSLIHKEHELIKKTRIKGSYKGLEGLCFVHNLSELNSKLESYPIRGATLAFFPSSKDLIPKRWKFVKEVCFAVKPYDTHRFTNRKLRWLNKKTKLILPYINASEEYIYNLCIHLKLKGLTALGFNYHYENNENDYSMIIEDTGLEILDATTWIPLS